MGLKNSQYQAIMRKYEQKQLRNHDILTQHYEEVYRQLPEFKSLDDSISILSVQYGKRLLNGDQKAISSLKEELAIYAPASRSFYDPVVFRLIIWNRSMIVRIVKIPDISETKNVTVSKKPSLTCFMNSQT